jgi:hypothetical protein
VIAGAGALLVIWVVLSQLPQPASGSVGVGDRDIRADSIVAADDRLDADELRRIAEDIIGQPAYTGEYSSPWQQWLYDNPVTRWLRDVWERFTRWITERFRFGGDDDPADPDAVDPNRSSYGLALVLVTAAGAVAIAWLLARRKTQEDADVLEWFEAVPESLRSRQALEDAASAAALRGEHRDAIRYRFLAGLLALDESARIRLEPHLRMHQLRSAVDEREFDAAAAVFERAVYSSHPPAEADVAAHQLAWTQLLAVRADA